MTKRPVPVLWFAASSSAELTESDGSERHPAKAVLEIAKAIRKQWDALVVFIPLNLLARGASAFGQKFLRLFRKAICSMKNLGPSATNF
jgi:hypothetical protein